jgi:hypothetical protein
VVRTPDIELVAERDRPCVDEPGAAIGSDTHQVDRRAGNRRHAIGMTRS